MLTRPNNGLTRFRVTTKPPKAAAPGAALAEGGLGGGHVCQHVVHGARPPHREHRPGPTLEGGSDIRTRGPVGQGKQRAGHQGTSGAAANWISVQMSKKIRAALDDGLAPVRAVGDN